MSSASYKTDRKKSAWYGRMTKKLSDLNISWAEWKQSPAKAMANDPAIFEWLSHKYESQEPIEWYKRETTLKQDLKKNERQFFNKLKAEHHPWILGK